MATPPAWRSSSCPPACSASAAARRTCRWGWQKASAPRRRRRSPAASAAGGRAAPAGATGTAVPDRCLRWSLASRGRRVRRGLGRLSRRRRCSATGLGGLGQGRRRGGLRPRHRLQRGLGLLARLAQRLLGVRDEVVERVVELLLADDALQLLGLELLLDVRLHGAQEPPAA